MTQRRRNKAVITALRCGMYGSLASFLLGLGGGLSPYFLLGSISSILAFMLPYLFYTILDGAQMTPTEVFVTVFCAAIGSCCQVFAWGTLVDLTVPAKIGIALAASILVLLGSVWGWYTKKRLGETRSRVSLLLIGWMLVWGLSAGTVVLLCLCLLTFGVQFGVFENESYVMAVMAVMTVLCVPALRVEHLLWRKARTCGVPPVRSDWLGPSVPPPPSSSPPPVP